MKYTGPKTDNEGHANYAYVLWLEAKVIGLHTIIASKLHQRKCHDCGHVGYYADARAPYCLCDNCGSLDTRRVKEWSLGGMTPRPPTPIKPL